MLSGIFFGRHQHVALGVIDILGEKEGVVAGGLVGAH